MPRGYLGVLAERRSATRTRGLEHRTQDRVASRTETVAPIVWGKHLDSGPLAKSTSTHNAGRAQSPSG